MWRRFAHFQAAKALDPATLPKSRRQWTRTQTIGASVLAGGLALYGYDYAFNASAITRAVRCVYNITFIGLDYKLNFKEGKDINALHERSADRLLTLLIKNKGLYIKMGQAIAVQEGIFPPAFQKKLKQLFDSAPQDSWDGIEKLFVSEFGAKPDEFFKIIDHRAHASASVSQVHKAQLKNGDIVAVKIQHCDIQKQVKLDLLAYRGLMYFYEKVLFKVPLYFVADYVSSRLMQEVDFVHEVSNTEKLRAHLENDPSLRDRVHIPKVYPELSTKRVIVSEWIDGVPFSNRPQLAKSGFNMKAALKDLYTTFAKQFFEWGDVHCDPHPGNIFLRYHPETGKQQLVLLDHGLYVELSEQFRRQYSNLWRSMFVYDFDGVRKVTDQWGFGNAEFFTASTLIQKRKLKETHDNLKPKSQEEVDKSDFQEQKQMSQIFKSFIRDTTKIPLDLIFLGRCLRILQGLNVGFGSPVNQVKIFAFTASHAATIEKHIGIRGFFTAWTEHFLFWFTVTMTDLAYFVNRVRNLVWPSSTSVEEVLEDEMVETFKNMKI